MSASVSHPVRRADIETFVLPDGTTLLYNPVTESGLPLDTLSSLIWDYCDGELSDAEIASEIVALLPQIANVEAHVLTVIQGFDEYGLLTRSAHAPSAH